MINMNRLFGSFPEMVQASEYSLPLPQADSDLLRFKIKSVKTFVTLLL